MRTKGSPEELERRRRRAIDLWQQGEKPADICRILGVSLRALQTWRRAVELGGPDALAAKPRLVPKRLDGKQLPRLAEALAQGSTAHGWANDLWTGNRVAALIHRLFGVTYPPDHVRVLLRKTLHWTRQKPERRGRERDEEEIERWRTREFPRIKKTERRGAHLLFLDETGFMLTPVARRTFAPKGRTPIPKCWARHGRVSVISAISVSPKRQRLGLSFRRLPANTGAKAEDTVSFPRQVHRCLPGPLTEVGDRSRIHDPSKVVRAWLSKHPEVVTERFPGYAPELNPESMSGRMPNTPNYAIMRLRTWRIWEKRQRVRSKAYGATATCSKASLTTRT